MNFLSQGASPGLPSQYRSVILLPEFRRSVLTAWTAKQGYIPEQSPAPPASGDGCAGQAGLTNS